VRSSLSKDGGMFRLTLTAFALVPPCVFSELSRFRWVTSGWIGIGVVRGSRSRCGGCHLYSRQYFVRGVSCQDRGAESSGVERAVSYRWLRFRLCVTGLTSTLSIRSMRLRCMPFRRECGYSCRAPRCWMWRSILQMIRFSAPQLSIRVDQEHGMPNVLFANT
jgi:hypothetical protein